MLEVAWSVFSIFLEGFLKGGGGQWVYTLLTITNSWKYRLNYFLSTHLEFDVMYPFFVAAQHRRGWSDQRGEYRNNWNYSPPRHSHSSHNRWERNRGRSPLGTRVRKYDRSSSRSPSHSRSQSRSYSSRSRSSSHSPRRNLHRRRSVRICLSLCCKTITEKLHFINRSSCINSSTHHLPYLNSWIILDT